MIEAFIVYLLSQAQYGIDKKPFAGLSGVSIRAIRSSAAIASSHY